LQQLQEERSQRLQQQASALQALPLTLLLARPPLLRLQVFSLLQLLRPGCP
jgi:hypothetical protein